MGTKPYIIRKRGRSSSEEKVIMDNRLLLMAANDLVRAQGRRSMGADPLEWMLVKATFTLLRIRFSPRLLKKLLRIHTLIVKQRLEWIRQLNPTILILFTSS